MHMCVCGVGRNLSRECRGLGQGGTVANADTRINIHLVLFFFIFARCDRSIRWSSLSLSLSLTVCICPTYDIYFNAIL